MFTTGSKCFFGLAAAALLGAMVYGGATNPNEVGMSTLTGVLTLGYKGGVGDHLGCAILMGIAGAAVFLGATTAAFRDADRPRPARSCWPSRPSPRSPHPSGAATGPSSGRSAPASSPSAW